MQYVIYIAGRAARVYNKNSVGESVWQTVG